MGMSTVFSIDNANMKLNDTVQRLGLRDEQLTLSPEGAQGHAYVTLIGGAEAYRRLATLANAAADRIEARELTKLMPGADESEEVVMVPNEPDEDYIPALNRGDA